MVQLNPVTRANLEAFIKDQRTVFDFESLFLAVLELQGYMAQPGDIVFSAGTTRGQALAADGASYLRTDYADLFAKIGVTYGAADALHFNVPNVAGRVIAGKESVATLITTAVSGFSGATLGATGGAQSHVLITNEMPSHTHPVASSATFGTLVNNTKDVWSTVAGGGAALLPMGSTGADAAHRNVQPTIILNAFILY